MILSIEDKIDWAEETFLEERRSLLADKRLSGLLRDLERSIAATHHRMEVSGIIGICARCEEEEGGSCCGRGIENRYDRWTLLINLLLGVALPKERMFNDSCFFLGKKGCLLKARHVICINYMCKRLERQIPAKELEHLRNEEGEEIERHFVLHEYLISLFRGKHALHS